MNKSHPVPLLLPSRRACGQQAAKTVIWGRDVNLGYLPTSAFTAGTPRQGRDLPDLLPSYLTSSSFIPTFEKPHLMLLSAERDLIRENSNHLCLLTEANVATPSEHSPAQLWMEKGTINKFLCQNLKSSHQKRETKSTCSPKPEAQKFMTDRELYQHGV